MLKKIKNILRSKKSIQRAIERGDKRVIKNLLKESASTESTDVEFLSREYKEYFQHSIEHDSFEVADIFLEWYMEKNIINNLLESMARQGRAKELRYILGKIDNKEEISYSNAITWSVDLGERESFDILIEDINENHYIAMSNAMYFNDLKVVDALSDYLQKDKVIDRWERRNSLGVGSSNGLRYYMDKMAKKEGALIRQSLEDGKPKTKTKPRKI